LRPYNLPVNRPPKSGPTTIAFLLTQIGAHASSRFADRLVPLDLLPQHAGILRMLGQSSGISQQELAARLEMHASRLVGLVDALEKRGLVERQSSATDRRMHSLHLTESGRHILKQLTALAREHDNTMCEGLSTEERTQLLSLLARIAERQGLTRGVHPGYRTQEQLRDSPPTQS
jgi:DNA-binding MarR family transcriptional regulator